MCQWCSSRFLRSISYSSCLPLPSSGWLNYFTFSTLSHLSTWNTFCYHLGFHCGYNRLQHCICVDNTTSSRLWVPCHIQVHLSSFGIIAIELLVSTIIPPRWLFIVNLWLILIVGVLCLCKQIYQLLCYTAILVFNAVPGLFGKICQLVHQIYNWLLRIFQSVICQDFSSREWEDNDNQGLEMV